MMNQSIAEATSLIESVRALRDDMLRLVKDSAELLRDIHPQHQLSAKNLLHYLALRSYDLRPLQTQLAAAGLSSLGRAESHVLAAVTAVLGVRALSPPLFPYARQLFPKSTASPSSSSCGSACGSSCGGGGGGGCGGCGGGGGD